MLNGLVKKLGSNQQQVYKGPQLPCPDSYMHKNKTFLN